MAIQWYPGHMRKASKAISAMLPQVDLIIEVLDARLPFSSQNPMLARLAAAKPCLRLLNKSDLADPELTERWRRHFEQERGVMAVPLVAAHHDQAARVPELCRRLLAAKPGGRLPHALVSGIPNVGKSTLINSLAGRAVAKTGNEPAITRQPQRVALEGGLVLVDTPGLLWPNLENRHGGYRLAATGAVKDAALDHEEVAWFAAEFLLARYPQALRDRYGLADCPGHGQQLLAAIGRRRGCLRQGGVVDMDKAAKLLLAELRAGLLGRLSWETPEMMREELAALALCRQQQARKPPAPPLYSAD